LDQRIFLDFEYVFGISVVIVLFLIYVFYIKYPYDRDLEEMDAENHDAETPTRVMRELKK